MLEINSGHVIGDDIWLWRADHTEGGDVKGAAFPCQNGLVVNGDDVIMYGLAVEHTLQDLVLWNGERGRTYFFQGELPYDVTQEGYGDKGYTGYRVGPSVLEHAAFGVGVYHYFRDYPVTVEYGLWAPKHLEGSFVSPLVVYLNGQGLIRHILNDKGASTSRTAGTKAVPEWLCSSAIAQNLQSSEIFSGNASCKVGDNVKCPGSSVGCSGNQCCQDGSVCPSADPKWKCCAKAKKEDCTWPNSSPHLSHRPFTPLPMPGIQPSLSTSPTPPLTPSMPGGPCKVGDSVLCPGTSMRCAGDQCCPDGSTCPSAESSFGGCQKEKTMDCTDMPTASVPSAELKISV